jgi:iron complex outermembrane receptor protein
MAQTYAGIGALLAGANLTASWGHLDLAATWNWAEQTDTKAPLAEIQPLLLSADLRSPAIGPATARLSYQHAAGQGRVDPGLDERSTGAWDRVDLGLDVATTHATFFLTLENAFNELYAQHLSYTRNPFNAGVSVREPGRTVRLGATLDY